VGIVSKIKKTVRKPTKAKRLNKQQKEILESIAQTVVLLIVFAVFYCMLPAG